MKRGAYLAIMERAACERLATAQRAASAAVMSGFTVGAVRYHGDSHWRKIEDVQRVLDRERRRHRHWLNLHLAHSGLSPIGS